MSKRKNYRNIKDEMNVLLSFGKKQKQVHLNANSEIVHENIDYMVQLESENVSESCDQSEENSSEYSTSKISSDGDEVLEEIEFCLENDLAEWTVKFNTTNECTNELLKILRKYHPYLPKDCRTLKRTPQQNNVIGMGYGSYFHFGIKP